MVGSRTRLGYFPKGGTIRLNTRAMQTNTAGRTICKRASGLIEMRRCLRNPFIQVCVQAAEYLSKEAFPGSPSVEEPLPQQCHELLSLQTPAFNLVGTFAVCSAEPVGLPGVWTQNREINQHICKYVFELDWAKIPLLSLDCTKQMCF